MAVECVSFVVASAARGGDSKRKWNHLLIHRRDVEALVIADVLYTNNFVHFVLEVDERMIP